MPKKSLSQLEEYWHELSLRFGQYRDRDPFALSIVCTPGLPRIVNAYFDYFQRRAVEKALRRLRPNLRNRGLLDIGCGGGRWSQFFQDHGCNVKGIDIQERTIRGNREMFPTIDFEVMSVTNLLFPNNSFDLLCSVTVLQHLPYREQEEAVREIARVLRPEGLFFLLESTDESDAPHMFPRRAVDWQELAQQVGLVLSYQDALGYDPIFLALTRMLHVFRKGLGLPETLEVSSSCRGGETLPGAWRIRLKRSLFAVAAIPSYPVEYVSRLVLPQKMASHTLMIYTKQRTVSEA
jgi:SAM-dependent methyltransferase